MIKIVLKNGALLEKPKVIIDNNVVGNVSSGNSLTLDLTIGEHTLELEGVNGRSLPTNVNLSDNKNIEEFIFSPNWSRSFKGGYYELITHNTIEKNNNVITNYKNPNTLNTAGTIIYGIAFAIFLIIFLGCFLLWFGIL